MARIRLYTDREMMALGLGQALLGCHDLDVMGLDSLADPMGACGFRAHVLMLDAPAEASHLFARMRSLDPEARIVVWERGSASVFCHRPRPYLKICCAKPAKVPRRE